MYLQESVIRNLLRSCSPSQSDSLPHSHKALPKEQLNKLQISISKSGQLSEDVRVTQGDSHVHRSSSLKANPDKYRLSPTREQLDDKGRVRLWKNDTSPTSPDDHNKENTDVAASKPVTVRRSMSLKAKLLLGNDLSDESLSSFRRSSSFRSKILPDKDLVNPDQAGHDQESSTAEGGTSPPSQNAPPHKVIIKGKEETSPQKQKMKQHHFGILSKLKLQK